MDKKKLIILGSGGGSQVQADWDQTNIDEPDYIKNKPNLATVATTGDYDDLNNKPTIPVVNDATITVQQGGEVKGSFTLNQNTDQTIELDKGGESWYGSQAQFNLLGEYDDDTDYFISEINYDEIKGTPDLSTYATKSEVNAKDDELEGKIASKQDFYFMTQQEFDDLGNNIPEGKNIFVQGDTIEVVVTFTDQSTATYNVVID